MRNQGQLIPDHAAILATLQRSRPVQAGAAPGTVVRVTGTAQAGPDGPLRAPLSGRPCVWFRVLEWRHPAWQTWTGAIVSTPAFPPILTSDIGLGVVSDVADTQSPAPFAIAGPDGELLVDPSRADVDAPLVSIDTSEGTYGITAFTLRREWILEAGAPVFALGPVTGGNPPTLQATPADCLVVSGRGEQVAVQRSQGAVAAAPIVADLRRRVVFIAVAVGGVLAVVMVVLVLVLLLG